MGGYGAEEVTDDSDFKVDASDMPDGGSDLGYMTVKDNFKTNEGQLALTDYTVGEGNL